jgi:hypothetical protein
MSTPPMSSKLGPFEIAGGVRLTAAPVRHGRPRGRPCLTPGIYACGYFLIWMLPPPIIVHGVAFADVSVHDPPGTWLS